MDPEQRHVIKFLRMKGPKLGKIAKELSTVYSPDAYTPSSIKYRLHQIIVRRTDLRAQHAGGRPLPDDIDAEFLSLLRKHPFSSVQTITESLKIPVSTLYSPLVEKIGC
jgi:hypothetical protein